MLIRITAPHFCAGVVIVDGKVTRCAPILRYMRGWITDSVHAYCKFKHWQAENLGE
jgi:hypothetical protein